MSGIQTEATTDTGGGINVGWIDSGDWLEYAVNVASSGTYTAEYRVAALSATGSINLIFDGASRGTVTVPVTGGWQTWTTVSHAVSLSSGIHTIRLSLTAGGFNINWLRFSIGTIPNTPVPTQANTPAPTPVAGLLWSDEFNGSGLPSWDFDLGGGGWGNGELETYTNSTANCNQSGGYLYITAIRSGTSYTSARIKSRFSRTYGRVEARLKIPMGQGLWPAFWGLGTNFGSVGWPACGEIDIMEHINGEGQTHGYIHWDAGGHASYGTATAGNPAEWNTYSIVWNSSAIRWQVNGNQFNEANIANSINSTEEFHRPFFLILNLAVGGAWPGSPGSSTAFPAQYIIDYVRWYSN
ncbi:MAG: carbohydrate-binding protein [Spirochaetales bacterium]|nr:carbohydrate-binding protein [Spirochaetales bacterium]